MSARAVRREGPWSPEGPLDVTEAPTGALLRNVDARTLTSPVQGFGKLWRKKYELTLPQPSVTAEELVAIWKAEYPTFWSGRGWRSPTAPRRASRPATRSC